MKNLKIILAGISVIGLIVLSVIAVQYISKEQPVELDMTIMMDLTEESFLSTPEKDLLKPFPDSNQIFWQGYHFRLVGISSVSYTPAYEAEIKPEHWYTGEVLKRKKMIRAFYEDFDLDFHKLSKADRGHENSVIVTPLERELTRLAQSKAIHRRLMVYSDLMEHSSLISFYEKSTLDLMQSDPDSLWKKLQKKEWPDLTGIEVMFIHQPRNHEENDRFAIVSEFLKNELEKHGAKISISAN